MKFLYLNLSIINIRCEGKDKTKEQWGCISIVVPSKKMVGNNVKDIIGVSNAYNVFI